MIYEDAGILRREGLDNRKQLLRVRIINKNPPSGRFNKIYLPEVMNS